MAARSLGAAGGISSVVTGVVPSISPSERATTWIVPGVVVERTVAIALPLTTVTMLGVRISPGPLDTENVTCELLSFVAQFPSLSWMVAVSVVVETPSADMLDGCTASEILLIHVTEPWFTLIGSSFPLVSKAAV